MEYKSFDFEIKGIDEAGKFSGYASTFGNVDLVGDIVQKGSFLKTLQKGADKVFMFWQHDSSVIVGEFTKLVEDEKGLFFEGQLFIKNIQQATEAHFLMRKGLIKSVSIGFRLDEKSFDQNNNRLLKEIDLMEISLVTFPANPEATIDRVKSLDDMTEREFEKSLRDVVGLSKKQSKALMSGGYKAMSRDDSEPEQKTNNLSEVLNHFKNK